ncbi:MAG: NAD-dependent epimerase/dehydratase family protein, partial [Terriglobales bacterium]
MKDKREAEATNVQGTRNVLELMRELGIPKGVYTSTLGVNEDTGGQLVDETHRYTGPYFSEYTRTKAEAHRLAETFIADGLPLVIVMPGLIYGPGDTSSVRTTLLQYLQRQLPMIPRQSAFCWAHVDDIARAHILAMEKGTPGQTYIIAGPMHTFVEGMKLAEQITGIPSPRTAPAGLFKVMSAVMGVVEKIIPVPEAYTRKFINLIKNLLHAGLMEDWKFQKTYSGVPQGAICSPILANVC